MLEIKQKNKGITLVVLVVTIVVLLILAGVTISALSGDNGILFQAARAKQENEKASIIEEIKLDIFAKQTDNLGNINENELFNILEKYGTVSDDGATLITNKGKYEILISDIYSGNIESFLVTTPLESWEYTLDENNNIIILTKYIGKDKNIFIPSSFNINNIVYTTKIGATSSDSSTGPFINNENIISVKFDPNISVRYSGDIIRMFKYCYNLEKVYNLPTNYTSLQQTFLDCKKLKQVPTLEEGLTTLTDTFSGCTSLINVSYIPSTVTNMVRTFSGCINLEGNIEMKAENIADITSCFNGTEEKINLIMNNDSVTYNKFTTGYIYNNVYFEGLNKIACYGDSLTKGAGGNGTTYPNVLNNLCVNSNVINFGVSEETSKAIATRQGGISLYVAKFDIPAETSKVPIELFYEDGSKVIIAREGTVGLNPCYIKGIKGNITYNAGDDKYYFSRKIAGERTHVNRNELVITQSIKNYKDTNITVIWSGQNDNVSLSNINEVIENQKSMIQYNNIERYIIIGLLYAGDEVNNIMASVYGEHFLDIRPYLSKDGTNVVSADYKSDSIHLNADGYTIVGQQVYNKLISLGYITE